MMTSLKCIRGIGLNITGIVVVVMLLAVPVAEILFLSLDPCMFMAPT